MRRIPLYNSQGSIVGYATVDDRDHAALSAHRWHKSPYGYAVRGRRMSDGPGPAIIYMHRVLVRPEDGLVVDHINDRGTDNRRSNLRVCTIQQNVTRQRKGRWRGTCFDKKRGKWVVHIKVNGKQQHLGRFDKRTDAARAYNAAARKLFGKFARLNPV